jgi:hypothetical protein
MGRRKDCYTDEEKDEIVAHILVEVCKGRTVTEIIRDDPGLCSDTAFWKWHWGDEELRGKLADARANGVEARLEEAVMIARTPMTGEVRVDKHIKLAGELHPVTEIHHEDMLGHRKLLVDTLIKSAQMLKPKTYGPKLDLTSGGEKMGLAAELDAAVKREEERLRKERG